MEVSIYFPTKINNNYISSFLHDCLTVLVRYKQSHKYAESGSSLQMYIKDNTYPQHSLCKRVVSEIICTILQGLIFIL